jgi:hypothetical protein
MCLSSVCWSGENANLRSRRPAIQQARCLSGVIANGRLWRKAVVYSNADVGDVLSLASDGVRSKSADGDAPAMLM